MAINSFNKRQFHRSVSFCTKGEETPFCGSMWVCQLLPPPFLGLPTVLEHKSDSSKRKSFHGISYKKNGQAMSSLVSWSYQWKACQHFWRKPWLAHSSLYGWLLFLPDERSRLVSEGKTKEATGPLSATPSVISLLTFLVCSHQKPDAIVTSQMLF